MVLACLVVHISVARGDHAGVVFRNGPFRPFLVVSTPIPQPTGQAALRSCVATRLNPDPPGGLFFEKYDHLTCSLLFGFTAPPLPRLPPSRARRYRRPLVVQ